MVVGGFLFCNGMDGCVYYFGDGVGDVCFYFLWGYFWWCFLYFGCCFLCLVLVVLLLCYLVCFCYWWYSRVFLGDCSNVGSEYIGGFFFFWCVLFLCLKVKYMQKGLAFVVRLYWKLVLIFLICFCIFVYIFNFNGDEIIINVYSSS